MRMDPSHYSLIQGIVEPDLVHPGSSFEQSFNCFVHHKFDKKKTDIMLTNLSLKIKLLQKSVDKKNFATFVTFSNNKSQYSD